MNGTTKKKLTDNLSVNSVIFCNFRRSTSVPTAGHPCLVESEDTWGRTMILPRGKRVGSVTAW